MSLRLKAIFGIACLAAGLMILLISMTLDYLRPINNDGLIKRASTTATSFATTTLDAVLSTDLVSLESFVDEVLINPDLVYARILGPDNKLFAQGGKAKYLQHQFVADQNVEAASDGVFDTFAEIKEAGVVYGRVEIGLDINSINTTIAQAQSRSAIVAALEMGLAVLCSFLLGAYLAGQLKVLSLKEASTGRDQVETETELKELNRSLESRVEQRTRQLKSKNSELELANREIKQAQAKLLHSEKMASIGVLAAGVAHEINNPIGFVMSNLRSLTIYGQSYRALINEYQRLAELTEPADRQEQRHKIGQLCDDYDLAFMNEDLDSLLSDSIEGVERVRDIVKGLKEFSHVDTVVSYWVCDLNECIKSTLRVVINELKYHCDVQTDLGDLPLTYCCPGQINQVLLNLLLNAGHAIEGRGIIRIRSRHNADRLEISVSDTGKGIPADLLDKLFDPFFTTKAVGEGAGLGLAIAYGIVQDHQGEIRVDSRPGEGSCFTLCLPVTKEPVSQSCAETV